MFNKVGYGIVDALFLISLKLEELFCKIRTSLNQFSDKRLDKLYEIETQRIPNTTYIPISTKVFRLIIKNAELPTNVSFLDYGSGKGKALILASEAGFDSITGIELSSELVEISKVNVQKYARKLKKKINIDIINGDATKYDELDNYNVFFFNNSFGGNPSEERIIAKVLKKIESSLNNKPK